MNPFGSNRSKSAREQVSATSHEVISSRYYVVYAACNNGELALVRSHPEITQPVVPERPVQVQPVVPQPSAEENPLWHAPQEKTETSDLKAAAYQKLDEIYASQEQAAVNSDEMPRKDQYGLAA